MPNPTNYIATSTELTATADAIRAKTGSTIPIEWEADEGFKDAIAAIQTGVDGLKNAICFSSPSSFTLAISNNTKGWNGTLEWTDGIHAWVTWDGTTTLTADSGVLYLRGASNTYLSSSTKSFVLTGTNISCDGNIETLLDYTTVVLGNHPTMNSSCYAYMFQNCTSLISAPILPATTLVGHCYRSMFYGCTGLISAPALPATTLATCCYYEMFYGCTSLISTPALPATTMQDSCYRSMFYGCTSLTSTPALPATTLNLAIANYCYQDMFRDCTSLTFAPELPATTLIDYCYYGMFRGCTSLISPPALPATTLAAYCYRDMFYGCTSLTSIPILSATTYVGGCCYQMFYGCTNIKVSQTYDSTNYPYAFRIPESGTGTTVSLDLYNMFTSTGGTFTSSPSINTVYYLSKPLPTDFTIDGNAAATDIRSGKITYANGARVVGSMANGTATAPASISGTGSSVSTGTNTLTLSKTVSVTPSVTAGYIASGTAGNSSVSLTASVTTKAAATITPTTSNQTIAAGTYLTGAQTIAGNANLVAGNIKSGVSIFGVTGTFAGDATVYKDAWSSRSAPEVDTSVSLALDNIGSGVIGATTIGDYALIGSFQKYNVSTGYYTQSNTVLYINKHLSMGYAPNMQVATSGSHGAETIGNYAIFVSGYTTTTANKKKVDTYTATLTHGTATDATVDTNVNYGMPSAVVGNYAIFLQSMSTVVGNAYNTSLTRSNVTAPSQQKESPGITVGNYAIFGPDGPGYPNVDTYNTSLTRTTATQFTTPKSAYGCVTVGNYGLFVAGYATGTGDITSTEYYTNTLTHGVVSGTCEKQRNPIGETVGNYGIIAGGTDRPGTVQYYTNTLTRTTIGTNVLKYYPVSSSSNPSGCTLFGYVFLFTNGNSGINVIKVPYNLAVSIPAGYTYSFDGETPVTVSSATSITKTSGALISGVVCKAATTRTGQIT